jgi:hypothetical protein
MSEIQNMEDYIQKRQSKGKTQREIAEDLRTSGYDWFSIESFILKYWKFPENEEA